MSKTYEFSHWVRTLNFEIPNHPAGEGSATMLEMKQILDARMSQGYELISATHLGDNVFYYALQREKISPDEVEAPKKTAGRPKKVVNDPAG